MDRLTKEQRRRTMQAVKSRDSKIEITLRRALWGKGFRYRKNYAKILGKPDVVFVPRKVAVFCDSEFWHGYKWAKKKYEIKSNRAFWFKKIERNIKRDREVTRRLRSQGWKVLRFWEHRINRNLDACILKIEKALNEGD